RRKGRAASDRPTSRSADPRERRHRLVQGERHVGVLEDVLGAHRGARVEVPGGRRGQDQAGESEIGHRPRHPADVVGDARLVQHETDLAHTIHSEMRVATYNIRHASLKGLDAIRSAVAALDADLVALQEVDRGVPRSGAADQAAWLGRALGMEARFGPAMRLDRGEYGLALLSRFPIADAHVHPLPSRLEPRIVLHAAVDLPEGARLEVAVTHLGLHPTERWEQMQELVRLLGSRRNTLLMGDFNETRTEHGFALLRSHWVDCLEE